jgi:YebC/PmpR family DNA-binding regulatory protein
MSGHNKWSTIKHKKAAADAKRGKAFSRLAKEITLAARQGGKDAEMNPRLRSALAAARQANMPADNVERAVKKGVGELQGSVMEEMTFEGYAPGGVGILVTCLSDNRNRTAANIRNLFEKNNGRLAGTNAVARQFQRKARFVVEDPALTEDRLLEVLLEAAVDVEDASCDEGVGEVIAPPEAFEAVAKALEAAGIRVSESGVPMVAQVLTEVHEEGIARQVTRLIEALEEDDDVQAVYANLSMSGELAAALAAD